MESTAKPIEGKPVPKVNRNASLAILRRHAHSLICDIKDEKHLKGHAWEQAVPGTPEGKTWFITYCMSKKALVSLRKELKNTTALIKFIKKTVS